MSVLAIGTAVVGAGASIYSASQAGKGGSAPIPQDPGKDLVKYVKGVKQSMPDMLSLEQEYRPQFGTLNIADQQQYLNALIGMKGDAQGQMQGQLNDARQQDIAGMQGQVGNVTNLVNSINPNGEQQMQQAQSLANDAYARSQGLNFEERRQADQQARQAFAGRGRLNDNAGVSAEIMNRQNAMAANRAEASQLGGAAYGMAQSHTSPILGLLGQIPGSMAMSGDVVGQAAGMIGKNTPQLINPDAGINMGMQNNANLNSYMQSQAAAKSNAAAQWGQVGSSLLGTAGQIYANR